MMRKTDEIRHEVVECPECHATCMLGHDVDGQVLCACCGNSFRADTTKEITNDQLRNLYSSHRKCERTGWIAFVKKN